MSEEYSIDKSNPLRLKRVKYQSDDEEDDQNAEEQILEEDIGGNKRRKFKKGTKVDTTQYNDDSSDEDYNGKEKVGNKEEKDDSDSDMFGSDDEEDKVPEKKEEKENSFRPLDMKEFDQETGVDSKLNAENSEDDNDDDDDEETKPVDNYYYDQEKTHKTDGIPRKEPKLDAFNLRAEQSEGQFDADGNFIRAESSDDEQDNQWLDGLKKKDIRNARKAQEERERIFKTRQKDHDTRQTEELLFELIALLQPVESPMEGLQRLNKLKPKKKSKKYRPSEEETKKEIERASRVTKITELAELLIEHGFNDIYDLEKEELMLKYKEESGEPYVKPQEKEEEISKEDTTAQGFTESKIWEFRWEGDGQVHGPYSTHEMKYWKTAYFQDRVEVRKVGTDEFVHVTKTTDF